MRYWDTSALLKLYAQEPDSTVFLHALVSFGEPVLTSELTRVELFSALRRKESLGDLVPGGANSLLNHFQNDSDNGMISILPVGTDVANKAFNLIETGYASTPPILIRSLDVIHVACAILGGCHTVVGTDARQRDLARVAGLAVFP